MLKEESASDRKRREMLQLEYCECNGGYQARDTLVQDQFYKMVQCFSIFVTVLLAFRVVINVAPPIAPTVSPTISQAERTSFIILMGVTGLIALFAIMSDLQSNASCKIAIRKRARCIEELLFPNQEAGLWRAIDHRDRYTEESIIKRLVRSDGKSDKNKHEPEKGVFVVAARLLILLWVIIVAAVIVL